MSKVTEQQRIFLDAYYDLISKGMAQRYALEKAKEVADYDTRISFKNILRGVPIAVIQEYNNSALLEMTPRAIYKVSEIMEDGSISGARNSLAAAMTVLDRQGTSKREIVDFNLQSENGLIFIPVKKTSDETPQGEILQEPESDTE